jgi:hypothetical protein
MMVVGICDGDVGWGGWLRLLYEAVLWYADIRNGGRDGDAYV